MQVLYVANEYSVAETQAHTVTELHTKVLKLEKENKSLRAEVDMWKGKALDLNLFLI